MIGLLSTRKRRLAGIVILVRLVVACASASSGPPPVDGAAGAGGVVPDDGPCASPGATCACVTDLYPDAYEGLACCPEPSSVPAFVLVHEGDACP